MDERCPSCGGELGSSVICPHCGWDPATAYAQSRKRSPIAILSRILLWGGLVALLALSWWRWVLVGPGPDLPTTLRWIALGDGGRAASLVTLHRAHEIASAAARYAIREVEPPSFDGDWAKTLAPYSTMAVRGWLPLLFGAADAALAPDAVTTFYRVEAVDGFGRPWKVMTRNLPRGFDPEADPQVRADLEAGLWRSFFAAGRPDFHDIGHLRLELRSAGPDGRFATPDDIVFTSYIPVRMIFRAGIDRKTLQRTMEAAYLRGRQLYTWSGCRWDLIDARLLAEHRLDTLFFQE